MARLRREAHTAHARQRLVHPPVRAGLRVRIRSAKPAPTSRPASSSGPSSSPARRRPHQTPRPPRAAVRLAARPSRPGRLMNRPPLRLARPGQPPPPPPATTASRYSAKPPTTSPGCTPPTGSATPASGCMPWPASSPRPNNSCPGRPRRPRPRTHLDPDRRTTRHHRRHSRTPLPEQAMINLTSDHRHNADDRTSAPVRCGRPVAGCFLEEDLDPATCRELWPTQSRRIGRKSASRLCR